MLARCPLVVLLAFSCCMGAEVRYEYIDLGTFGGRSSVAYDINNRGQVVGWAMAERTTSLREYDWVKGNWITQSGFFEAAHAFVYDKGTMVDLGRSREWSEATGINNAGRIVGIVGRAANYVRAFRSHFGPLDEVEDVGHQNPMIQRSSVAAINDRGQIVGDAFNGEKYVSFVYDRNRLIDMGSHLGAPSHTRAINNRGIVVGNSYLNSRSIGPIHAYAHDIGTGATIDLGTLGTDSGRLASYAEDVNDHGQIVGSSMIDQGPGTSFHHAFLYDNGEMIDLGTLDEYDYSEAYGINNRGQIVGRSSGAFLYENGQMKDLSTLTDGIPNGWFLSMAYAINDSGSIVGYAAKDADTRAFLLNPRSNRANASLLLDDNIRDLAGTFSPDAFPVPLMDPIPEPALIVMFIPVLLTQRMCRQMSAGLHHAE